MSRIFARIRGLLLFLAFSVACPGATVADDIDAYVAGAGRSGVYVHVVMDVGDTSLDRALCTFGVDCGPPFTTERAHQHLGDMYHDGEAVTAPGLFRAVLAAVIDEPQFNALQLSLLISNHQANPADGLRAGMGGGTVLRGYGRLQEQRGEFLRTLKSIPNTAVPNSHELQPRETYLEWLRYISGGDVLLGQNTRGNFGQADPLPDYDADIIAGGRYLAPFREPQSCPTLYSILFTQGASLYDDDLDSEIATQLPLPGQSSFEQLLAYLHDSSTDLLPQQLGAVSLQRTWVITSRDRPGRAAQQAAAGGGALLYIDEPRRLQSELTQALTGAMDAGRHPVEPVFVEDTFSVGHVLNDVFLPLYSPMASSDWPGNLKKLQLQPRPQQAAGGQAARVGQLVDAQGLPAIETSGEYKGQLRFDALTFWTDVASLAPGDGTAVPLRSDGRVVARGGAGQKIDGVASYAADPDGVVQYFIGDTNSDPRIGAYGPRQLFVEPVAGHAFEPLDANAATVSALRPLLDPVGDRSDDELHEVIRWARGQDVEQGSPAARHWLLGAILHSRPLALNYGATPGYSRSNPNIRLLFGSGDGIFHIVENTDNRGRHTGRELFGFYPRDTLASVSMPRDVRTNPMQRHYGVDGAPVVLKNDRNHDGTLDHSDADTAWVYFGLRRGGSSYFALDVSDPDAVPSLMWKISPTRGGDFDALGLTFSTPVVGKVNFSGVPEDVVIFAGGYHGGWDESLAGRIGKDLGADDDTVGNAIYIVNALSGELIWKAESGTTGSRSNSHYEHAGLVDSIPSTVSALVTPAGVIHRLYVGDTGGAVWRVDLPPNDGADDDHRRDHWFITKLADLGSDAGESGGTARDDRRFFHAPDIVRSYDAIGDFDGVLIQSGDRENPNETSVENALFYIKDRQVESGSALAREENSQPLPAGRFRRDDLQDRTDCVSGEQQEMTGENANTCATGVSANGWQVSFEVPGEKGLSSPLIDGGRVFASTFVPGDATACPPAPGRGRLHVLQLVDGSAVANELRSYELGEGIPAAAEVVGDLLLLPAGGADLYDLDGDGTRDNANMLPSLAGKLYRTWWREPGVDPL